MIANSKTSKTHLSFLLLSVVLLVIIGTIFIYSASCVYASERFASAHYYVKRHIIGLCIGITFGIVIQCIPFSFIKKYTPLFFISSLVLTAITLISPFSRLIHGSSRWISLFGFSFQPSELLKIGIILYTAQFLSRKIERKNASLKDFFSFVLIMMLVSLILLKQPDFGLTVTLIVTTCLMLFVANFHIRAVCIALLSMIPATVLLIIMRPYRLKRIITFLNPWADAQGSGFQIIQSLIAIGSGNITGLGIGQSKQKFFYLPMQHTDFIFSIIAEETGFIGATVLIFIFIIILYHGIMLAREQNDTFGALVITGFIILITFQALINIAVATGLVPTKGMGLPFVSYGNSALVSNLIMIGIIINCVRNNRKQHHRTYKR